MRFAPLERCPGPRGDGCPDDSLIDTAAAPVCGECVKRKARSKSNVSA